MLLLSPVYWYYGMNNNNGMLVASTNLPMLMDMHLVIALCKVL